MAVVNVETTHSEPFAGGMSFGRAGPYRRTDGVVTFGVDPDNRANGAIVDLGLAPRDAAGRVLFRSDFALIAPEESDRGNRGLIVDVVNRGRRYGMSSMFNLGDAPPEGSGEIPAGDGFLYRNGYSTISIGWQWDVYRSEGTDRAGGPSRSDRRQARARARRSYRYGPTASSAPGCWPIASTTPTLSRIWRIPRRRSSCATGRTAPTRRYRHRSGNSRARRPTASSPARSTSTSRPGSSPAGSTTSSTPPRGRPWSASDCSPCGRPPRG